MSQGADDSKSKRFSNPTHVYGPMVYQFPPEPDGGGGGGGEKEKPKSNQGINYLVLLLIIVLAVGGVILYLKENGIDVRDLSFRPTFGTSPFFRRSGERIFTPSTEVWTPAPRLNRGRVAVDRLYLRDGPGPEYEALYLLPENWEVSLLGETEDDRYGEAWTRVLVETNQGPQEGWVSRRYLDF
jgi:hypothetical protein